MTEYRVPALEKSIAILNLLASGRKKYTNTEIHKGLNISKATVFSILNVLDAHGLVKKNKKGEYEIGVKLYELGMSYVSDIDIVKIAHPYLEKLMKETGYTVHLGVLDGDELLYVDKVESDSFIKFSTFPGLRSEFHVTSLGKTIAAYMEEGDVHNIIAVKGLSKHTPNTITVVEEFMKELKKIRTQGFSLEDEEGEIGVRCIGAPIFNRTANYAVASVSIASHTSKLTLQSIDELIKRVQETALAISRELGFIGVVNSFN